MKKYLLIIPLLLLSSLCFSAPHFEGTYRCKGFDPYLNKAYSGIVKIVPYNTVYNLIMMYDTGEVSQGTAGLWDEQTIAVVFKDIKNPHHIGLERYTYSKDHEKIQGYWVYLGGYKLGKEVCEKES